MRQLVRKREQQVRRRQWRQLAEWLRCQQQRRWERRRHERRQNQERWRRRERVREKGVTWDQEVGAGQRGTRTKGQRQVGNAASTTAQRGGLAQGRRRQHRQFFTQLSRMQRLQRRTQQGLQGGQEEQQERRQLGRHGWRREHWRQRRRVEWQMG